MSDTLILHEGMIAFKEKLGLVNSEKFDYTQWQKNLWKGKSLKEIHEEAKNYFYENNKLSKIPHENGI